MINGKRVGAIIQARMGSHRLPGKVMMEVEGKPILQWMVDRLSVSQEIDNVVVATTLGSVEIVRWCVTNDVPFFIGDEDDVLKRVWDTANHFRFDYIVDLTSDCPLVDPLQVDHLLSRFRGPYDMILYASNIRPRMWPDGFDIQVYPIRELDLLNNLVTDQTKRCHVGWNFIDLDMIDGTNSVSLVPSNPLHCLPLMRLTLDYPEDFEVIKTILKHLGGEYCSAEDIIDYILGNPEVLVNGHLESKTPGEG